MRKLTIGKMLVLTVVVLRASVLFGYVPSLLPSHPKFRMGDTDMAP